MPPFFKLLAIFSVLSLLIPNRLDHANLHAATAPSPLTIAITADMRQYSGPGIYDNSHYFRGAVEAILTEGPGELMISPGDIDPPWEVRWSISSTLGSDYPWFPVAGNHETETAADMDYLRLYEYEAVSPGPGACPETSYSFDRSNVHLVVLNEYCDVGGDDVSDGDIPDYLFDWLSADLAATNQEHVLVFGHEPAYPQPDADNGRLRHESDSLNAHPANRDRFWDLLQSAGVMAYICGHTHNYSLTWIDGVWQLDAGHARGLGDTGAPSTFVLLQVSGAQITYRTYRDDSSGGAYSLRHAGALAGPVVFLPLLLR